jgi:hypothetical protein
MELAELIVKRRREDAGLFQTYRVVVDGEKVARLASGESCALSIVPGLHLVHVAIVWTRSPVLELDLAAGQTVQIMCHARGNYLTASLWGTFRPRHAIHIAIAGEGGNPGPEDLRPDQAVVGEWFKKRRAGRKDTPGR